MSTKIGNKLITLPSTVKKLSKLKIHAFAHHVYKSLNLVYDFGKETGLIIVTEANILTFKTMS